MPPTLRPVRAPARRPALDRCPGSASGDLVAPRRADARATPPTATALPVFRQLAPASHARLDPLHDVFEYLLFLWFVEDLVVKTVVHVEGLVEGSRLRVHHASAGRCGYNVGADVQDEQRQSHRAELR